MMVWSWLAVVLILIFIEAVTTNLVTIWFVASGIVAMALSIFIDSYLIQFAVFVLLGLILLICFLIYSMSNYYLGMFFYVIYIITFLINTRVILYLRIYRRVLWQKILKRVVFFNPLL